MSPLKSSQNIAARMGRWSARHWKTATFGWLAFVLVAFGLGGAVGTRNIANSAGPGESGRMDRILDDGFKQPADESVLIRSRSATAGTPAFQAAVTDVVARVSRVAAVQGVHRGAVSKDGHAALVAFTIRGDKDKAARVIHDVVIGSGVGAGHEAEVQLVLGTDAVQRAEEVRDKLQHTLDIFGDLARSVGRDS